MSCGEDSDWTAGDLTQSMNSTPATRARPLGDRRVPFASAIIMVGMKGGRYGR